MRIWVSGCSIKRWCRCVDYDKMDSRCRRHLLFLLPLLVEVGETRTGPADLYTKAKDGRGAPEPRGANRKRQQAPDRRGRWVAALCVPAPGESQ